jgi:phosphatidylglycerol---prolipoprotein diacylglyceryl transferase
MQQVLFHIPFTNWFVEGGLPVYGFGAMLFLTFVITAMIWGPRRAKKIGLPDGRMQDLAIILFVTGIAGARVVYMIQYSHQFEPDILSLAKRFVQIWNGGIVVYGAVFGGLIGYAGFYYAVLRKFKISGWKLADTVAPLIAAGMAVGRIGCYLNGCCWGQPVCMETQTVPLTASLGEFPILPAHAREQVCRPAGSNARMPQIWGLQTSTGFTIAPRPTLGQGDPRTLVLALEPGSQAETTGLRPGDRIVSIQNEPNRILVELTGIPTMVSTAVKRLEEMNGVPVPKAVDDPADVGARVAFDDPENYRLGLIRLRDLQQAGLSVSVTDRMAELLNNWPRGQGELQLGVARDGKTETINYIPRTVTFFPTQLYETVSMGLLVLLLVAFQPLRRHDGQMMVLLMLGYSAHRFLNEALRIEPTYALDLTLSQWISIGIFAAGLLMELFLRATMPKLPAGPQPLGANAA